MKTIPFLCRVLRVQKRKTVTFLYVAGFGCSKQLCDLQGILNEFDVGVMSIIKGECLSQKNVNGRVIYSIVNITQCVSSAYKEAILDEYTNKALSYKLCKANILNAIHEFLLREKFLRIESPFSTPFRGTSIASPLSIKGRYVNKYCKITHEFALKKLMAETLRPVYEIGYVARDAYNTVKNWFEYSVLEFVSPLHTITFIEEFIKFFIATAINFADEFGIEHADLSHYEIIDLSKIEIDDRDALKMLKDNTKNAILINSPVYSPLVKQIKGQRTETIWVYDGVGMAHGYQDENDWSSVYNYSKSQMDELAEKGIKGEISEDFIELLKIGMPDSVSIGIGIDRFFQKFFQIDSMKEYHKLLG